MACLDDNKLNYYQRRIQQIPNHQTDSICAGLRIDSYTEKERQSIFRLTKLIKRTQQKTITHIQNEEGKHLQTNHETKECCTEH